MNGDNFKNPTRIRMKAESAIVKNILNNVIPK